MGVDHRETKRALRRSLKAHPTIPGSTVSDMASRSACERLTRLRAVIDAEAFVAYAALVGEVDLGSALRCFDARPVFWPRLAGDTLEFRRSTLQDLRPVGRHGLREPLDGARLSGSGEGVVFLVPGMAFDGAGTRLGRGAGMYDRALSDFPSAVRIGVGCEARVRPALPADPWDVPMHLVVTESRLLGRGTARGMRKETNP